MSRLLTISEVIDRINQSHFIFPHGSGGITAKLIVHSFNGKEYYAYIVKNMCIKSASIYHFSEEEFVQMSLKENDIRSMLFLCLLSKSHYIHTSDTENAYILGTKLCYSIDEILCKFNYEYNLSTLQAFVSEILNFINEIFIYDTNINLEDI